MSRAASFPVIGAGVALAALYVVAGRFGLRFASVGGSVTLVWPPTGLAIAALVLGGRRLWPGVTAGAFLANALTPGLPLWAAGAIALGNTGEAVVAAALLRGSGMDPALRRVGDVLRLALVTAACSTPVSAAVGTATLWACGTIPAAALGPTFRVWWMGDLMGALIIAPLLFSLRAGLPRLRLWVRPPSPTAPLRLPVPRRSWPWRPVARGLEGAALVLATAGLSWLAFGPGSHRAGEPSFVRPDALFPPLLWAALRFGPTGAAWANATISAISVWGTVRHLGPFARPELDVSLLLLQSFMAMVALTSLILGAAVAERADAVRAREDFMAIASHELRTPLTPLTLQLARLRALLDGGGGAAPRPAEPARLVSVLERQVARLTRLVDVLLDVARLRRGPMSLSREPLDLAALSRETVEALADQLERVRSPVEVLAPGPVVGNWDRMRLQQALTNLLTNAMKYAPGAAITVSVRARGDRAELAVLDRGPGIARADQARLFRRFERLPGPAGAGGLGLGLYITREIVEAHGGMVRVTSDPGQGAAFTFELPLGRGADAA